MIVRKEISEEQAKAAIERGEFAGDIISAHKNVALILTQGWCPQWTAMRGWLKSLEKKGKPGDVDIHVFELVYNNTPIEREFLQFKESVFNNYEIPYVRYYIDGTFVGDSNYVSKSEFVARFQHD